MANTNKNDVVELDFDKIKDSLKEHLRDQEEFSDFDFEGSGINIFLDIMANNTHLNAFMANMLGNEMFLDSGDIRQSVVSKAKELGYLPRSVRASNAIIDVTINNVADEVPEGGGAPEQPAFIEMKAGTQFNSDVELIFSTNQEHLLYPTGSYGEYKKESVDIYDGRYIQFTHTVNSGLPDQKYVVPSVDADMSTLKVVVKPSGSSTEKAEYMLNDDLNVLTGESEVYFLHENAEGFYEVVFGDGVIGKPVQNGNVVTFAYIIASNKGDANGVQNFVPYERIYDHGSEDITLVTRVVAYNGAEKESIEQIKFHATKFFQSQRRAVTTNDYEHFLLRDYPFIESMNSWGGEYNDPPIYGKIFFAIKPVHTEFLSTKLKEEIKNDLIKKYNVVTVVPEIVDPDYLYVTVDTEAFYTRSKTTLMESELIALVTKTINDYFLQTTRRFKSNFLLSPMATQIDASNVAINNSLNDITIHKRVYPIAGMNQTFILKFSNALIKGSVESSTFNTESQEVAGVSVKTQIKDDGNGKLYSWDVINGIVINENIGDINYSTGEISYTVYTFNLPPDTLDVRIMAIPANKDVAPGNNQIIIPDQTAYNGDYNRPQGVKVSMIMTDTEVA